MRCWGSIVCLALLGLLSGCAAHRVPDRLISTDWTAVRGLAAGTEVAVYLSAQDIRYGRVEAVSEQQLTVRERAGLAALPRPAVERLAVRTATGTTRVPRIIKTSIGFAVVSGLAALVMAAVDEHGSARGSEWAVFVGGAAAGAAVGGMRGPTETYRERFVYIRP